MLLGRPQDLVRLSAWCALAVGLLLATATSASSQSLVCYAIHDGESAAQLSARIAGGSWNAYQTWFQILDESSRVVPKSQYDRIGPGWRACLDERVLASSRPARQAVRVATATRPIENPTPPPAATAAVVADDGLVLLWVTNARRLIRSLGPFTEADLIKLWIGATLILTLVGWKAVDGYVGRRQAVRLVMNHFAQRFVREFERPLIQRPAESPLRAQIQLRPGRGRLEILLAPGPGRRYPNLADHKKNVEYDVARVLRSLGDEAFVPGALYSQAGWVVVPLRFEANRKHTGVPCISSF